MPPLYLHYTNRRPCNLSRCNFFSTFDSSLGSCPSERSLERLYTRRRHLTHFNPAFFFLTLFIPLDSRLSTFGWMVQASFSILIFQSIVTTTTLASCITIISSKSAPHPSDYSISRVHTSLHITLHRHRHLYSIFCSIYPSPISLPRLQLCLNSSRFVYSPIVSHFSSSPLPPPMVTSC